MKVYKKIKRGLEWAPLLGWCSQKMAVSASAG